MTDIAVQLDQNDTLPSGKLCLEFANTADWHASPTPVETLHVYTDLIRWAQDVGLVDPGEAMMLLDHAQANPSLAQQIFEWALELREVVYRIFAAIAVHAAPADADLALLNEALPQALNGPALVASGEGFTWRYHTGSGLDCVLWPILRSAAMLLISPDLDRVGQCADDRGCGYLFFDSSRNRSRRWCDMNSCGNRAKAIRHQSRYQTRPHAVASLPPS